MLVAKVDASIGKVWPIVHDSLRNRKVCAHCVPKQLTDQQKELSMGFALQRLIWYNESHFSRASAGEVLLTFFFDVQSPLLEFLEHRGMCTVRQSKAYTGPLRTKELSCSWRVWFCSMITHLHMCPGSFM